MENTTSERTVNLVIGIVVTLAVIIMVSMEISKVNRDNAVSRKGSTVTNTK